MTRILVSAVRDRTTSDFQRDIRPRRSKRKSRSSRLVKMRAAIEQMIPAFEKKTSYKVNATFGSGGGTHKQIAQGEVFDVPVVQPPYADVTASGNVIENTATRLASVAVGGLPKLRKAAPSRISPRRSQTWR